MHITVMPIGRGAIPCNTCLETVIRCCATPAACVMFPLPVTPRLQAAVLTYRIYKFLLVLFAAANGKYHLDTFDLGFTDKYALPHVYSQLQKGCKTTFSFFFLQKAINEKKKPSSMKKKRWYLKRLFSSSMGEKKKRNIFQDKFSDVNELLNPNRFWSLYMHGEARAVKKKIMAWGLGRGSGLQSLREQIRIGVFGMIHIHMGEGIGVGPFFGLFSVPVLTLVCTQTHTHKRDGFSPWKISERHQSWILLPIDSPSAQSVIETYRLRTFHHPATPQKHNGVCLQSSSGC